MKEINSMKFSVTIPAYKRSFLQECIDSVLAQTYADFELIVVNDASPEDLDSVLNTYHDSRIHYYKNKRNCGALNVVDNWNICLNYVTGDYIICMGDDDKLKPNCLEEYYKLIKLFPHLNVYHARTEIIDENSKVIKKQEERPRFESVYSMIWYRWNGRVQYIGDFLFKVSTLREHNGLFKIPFALCSDDISVAIAAKENGIANINNAVFQYRINSQTISNNGNGKVLMEATVEIWKWYEQFLSEEPINSEDKLYWKLLKKSLQERFCKLRYAIIARDLVKNTFSNLWYWVKLRDIYSLSYLLILRSFISGFYYRLKIKKTNY